jgi:hypothetical protein
VTSDVPVCELFADATYRNWLIKTMWAPNPRGHYRSVVHFRDSLFAARLKVVVASGSIAVDQPRDLFCRQHRTHLMFKAQMFQDVWIDPSEHREGLSAGDLSVPHVLEDPVRDSGVLRLVEQVFKDGRSHVMWPGGGRSR